MEQEIQKLQARLDKAKEVFREMNAKDKEKDARIAELEAQLAEATTNTNVDDSKLIELEAQLKTMEQRYNDADGYCKKLDEDNTYLTDQNEMLRNQIEGSKTDINELIEANAKLKEQNEKYEIVNEDLRFENMKNKGERDRIEIDYNALSESFKTVTEENAKLKEIVIEHTESKKALESSLEYVNSEKDRLLSELEQANNYITKKETHFNSLQTLLNDERAHIFELEKTIEHLSSSNKMLEDELGQARHDNSLLKENVTKHVAAIKSSMKGLNDGLGTDFDIFG